MELATCQWRGRVLAGLELTLQWIIWYVTRSSRRGRAPGPLWWPPALRYILSRAVCRKRGTCTCGCASEVTDLRWRPAIGVTFRSTRSELSSDRVPTLPLAWSVLVDSGRGQSAFSGRTKGERHLCGRDGCEGS